MNNKYFKMMVMAAFAASSFTACKQDMDDWGTDDSFNRPFSPTSVKISEYPNDASKAQVEFSLPKGSTHFEIDLSEDSLYDGVNESSLKLKSFKFEKSPATISGLQGDTKYYLRSRSVVEGVSQSKWVFLQNEKYTYKTPKEQIMKSVPTSDIGEDCVTVSWNSTPDVTHLLVSTKGQKDVTVQLDAVAKEAGEYTVSGLAPSTTYDISIWNNDAQRGYATITTFAAAPKADYVYRPTKLSVINDVLIAQLAEEAKAKAGSEEAYSVTIVIPAGSTIDICGVSEDGSTKSLVLPEGMSINFFGGAGATPRVKLTKSIDIAGSRDKILFDNLIIEDSGCTYIINQTAAASVNTISFLNCEIEKVKSIVRIQGSNAITVKETIVDNCIIRNHVDGYSLFHYDNSKQTVNSISVSKTTLYNINRGFVQNTKTDMAGGLTVTDCTINDAIISSRYLVDLNGKKSPITFKNVIIGTLKDGARGCRTSGEAVYENVYQTSDILVPAVDGKAAAKFSSNDMKLDIQDKSAADIFTDPAKGDFTLKISDKVGDPRWYQKAE